MTGQVTLSRNQGPCCASSEELDEELDQEIGDEPDHQDFVEEDGGVRGEGDDHDGEGDDTGGGNVVTTVDRVIFASRATLLEFPVSGVNY